MSNHEPNKQPLTLIERVLSLSRQNRMLLVLLFTGAIVLAVFPLVDRIYLLYFFTMETRIVPSLVSAGMGAVIYLLGWYWLVGTIGERPPARRVVLWYVLAGTLAIFLDVLLVIQGFVMMASPG